MTKQEFMAMSLPYGLMCNVSTKSGYYYTLVEYKPLDYENKFTHKVLCSEPILHPLSDLTKEIEHKGERFVPIERIRELNLGTMPKNNTIGWMYYQQVQKLIEWHFDIADLISKGEAMDVNTLDKNPYK